MSASSCGRSQIGVTSPIISLLVTPTISPVPMNACRRLREQRGDSGLCLMMRTGAVARTRTGSPVRCPERLRRDTASGSKKKRWWRWPGARKTLADAHTRWGRVPILRIWPCAVPDNLRSCRAAALSRSTSPGCSRSRRLPAYRAGRRARRPRRSPGCRGGAQAR